jgi:hypothetical protein
MFIMQEQNPFNKKSTINPKTQEIIDDAADKQESLKNKGDYNFNISNEDQINNNSYQARIMGKNPKKGSEEITSMEKNIKARYEEIRAEIVEINDYISRNSGTEDWEMFDKLNQKLISFKKDLEEQEKVVGEYFRQHIQKGQSKDEIESDVMYQGEQGRLYRIKKDIKDIQAKILEASAGITPEEEDELNEKIKELEKEAKPFYDYLYSDFRDN